MPRPTRSTESWRPPGRRSSSRTPALRRSARHLSDNQIKAVASKGGVIGIWPWESRGAGGAQIAEARSLNQMISDIDHVRRLVGIDHVGIGTDMDGMSVYTAIPTYKEFAPLPAALIAKGFSESDARKLLGGILVRVIDAATAARAS